MQVEPFTGEVLKSCDKLLVNPRHVDARRILVKEDGEMGLVDFSEAHHMSHFTDQPSDYFACRSLAGGQYQTIRVLNFQRGQGSGAYTHQCKYSVCQQELVPCTMQAQQNSPSRALYWVVALYQVAVLH
jgi:hypothetical protein